MKQKSIHLIHEHPWMQGKYKIPRHLVIVDKEYAELFDWVINNVNDEHILVTKEEYEVIKKIMEENDGVKII